MSVADRKIAAWAVIGCVSVMSAVVADFAAAPIWMGASVSVALFATGALLLIVRAQGKEIAGLAENDVARSWVRDAQARDATHIARFSEGVFGKISGKVSFIGTPLTAPLSGRPCAAYRLVVEERVGGRWRTLWSHDVGTQFRVTDDSGSAVVRALGATARVTMDHVHCAPREGLRVAAEAGFKKSFGGRKELRYREGILTAGENAVVVGRGHWRLAPPAHSTFDRGVCELSIGASSSRPVLLCDQASLSVKPTRQLAPRRFGRVFRRLESAS